MSERIKKYMYVIYLTRGIAGPEREVIPEELHDEGGVLVGVLVQGVQLCYGIVKCLNAAHGLYNRNENHLSSTQTMNYLAG